MKNWPYAMVGCMLLAGTGAAAREPSSTAIFGFSLDDTSLQGETQGPRADEAKRLAALNAQLRDILARSGCCTASDLGDVQQRARGMDMRTCDGCDVDLARKLDAKISVTGWVQKVSNLILNINVVARSVSTGRVIEAGSVDIRGNTDESWSRGLSYLLRERLHPANW
ncbi:MAG: hypothetical protein QOF90_2931 [Acetobacteraceae bacterium]|nr:hypothetical protein [Acetobacteraceae bacterium]